MYLVFDTETNGKPKKYGAPVTLVDNWPRITQLAWALYDKDGKLMSSRRDMIKPAGWTIPTVDQLRAIGEKDPHFFERNNMSTERCEREGIEIFRALSFFTEALDAAYVLIAHNMSFDAPVIGAEMIRAAIKSEKRIKRICTMQTSTDWCQLPGPYGFKWPKLEELHEKLFGKKFDGAHDAGFDVEACAKCFFELKRRNIIHV